MPFHRLLRRSGSAHAHRSIAPPLERPRALRSTRLVLLASLLATLSATPADATPYPTPRSADELACNLARSRNGDDYRAWWDRIRGSSTYRDWFWNRIVPRRTDGACTAEVEQMFWHEAVPGNWSSIPALAGWDWPSGGYFTQTLWLQAIPGNWASGPAQSGWPWASGGYYTQTFWLRAVPDGWGPRTYTLGTLRDQSYYRHFFWTGAVAKNWGPKGYSLGRLSGQGYYRFWLWQAAVPENWASRPRESGWPWTSGGYYTQALWLHAIPENWRAWDGETGSLGRDYYATGGQGHYRVYFWEHAVPDNWVTQGDRVGGWPWGSGGYYTQFFWWRAVPEDWAPGADQSIGGIPGQGHYAFWLYHFAAPRGFAWRSGWSVRGSRDASYYLFFLHEVFPSVHAEYAGLARLTSGHLEGAGTPAPVRDWFDDSASAVVVLTFDTEGNAEQSCRVASLLRDEGVDATFFVEGGAAAALSGDATWRGCLAPFDIGNHTRSHVGATGFDVDPSGRRALFDMKDRDFQRADLRLLQSSIESTFGRTPETFRTPWCDGHRSFDGSVVNAMDWLSALGSSIPEGSRLHTDSSIATISAYARSRGIVPPVHLADLSVGAAAYPFALATSTRRIVEVPFSYPSDWTGANIHGLRRGAPPDDWAADYLVNVWKRNLDEIRAQNGVMVVLMHPWISGASDSDLAGLRSFIRYAKRLPGVRFASLDEVGRAFGGR